MYNELQPILNVPTYTANSAENSIHENILTTHVDYHEKFPGKTSSSLKRRNCGGKTKTCVDSEQKYTDMSTKVLCYLR